MSVMHYGDPGYRVACGAFVDSNRMTQNLVEVTCGKCQVTWTFRDDLVDTMVEGEQKTEDLVDHPDHYGGSDNPYEVIKVLDAWGFGVPFALASAIKYIARHGKKPGEDAVRDLKKSRWYLDWVVAKLEEERPAPF